jgi:pyruvate ferredoxin oxidoreductase beta subunit
MAVESGLFVLYEIENGEMRLTGQSEKQLKKKSLRPVNDYINLQTRYNAYDEEHVIALQAAINRKWEFYRREFATS